MGTGPKATVQWAGSRGGGVEYQIYTLQDFAPKGEPLLDIQIIKVSFK